MSTRRKKIYKLKSNFHAILKIKGPSGIMYRFEPGQVLEMYKQDRDHLLNQKQKSGGGCCGASSEQLIPYFEEVK